jgi:hypothetical protein
MDFNIGLYFYEKLCKRVLDDDEGAKWRGKFEPCTLFCGVLFLLHDLSQPWSLQYAWHSSKPNGQCPWTSF